MNPRVVITINVYEETPYIVNTVLSIELPSNLRDAAVLRIGQACLDLLTPKPVAWQTVGNLRSARQEPRVVLTPETKRQLDWNDEKKDPKP